VLPNGPAIWGGCVTRRSIRKLSWYSPAGEPYNCPGARRVWRGFCHHGTNFIEHYACRGTSFIGAANLSPVTKLVRALAQCRGTKLIEARKLSRYIGAKLRAEERVRVQQPLQNCLGCRSKSKKHDKQLTHIVRVMGRMITFRIHFLPRFGFLVFFCT
jgi:hypothetical protein